MSSLLFALIGPLTPGCLGQWEYKGCLQCDPIYLAVCHVTDLCSFREPNGARVFPYQNIFTNNNTIEGCLNLCASFGYPAAGAEFGDECCKPLFTL